MSVNATRYGARAEHRVAGNSGTHKANIKSQIGGTVRTPSAERNKAVTALNLDQEGSAVAEGDAEAVAVSARRPGARRSPAGIVHKRTAARRKSRLAKAANKVGASASAE
jgi:ribosomal protein S20